MFVSFDDPEGPNLLVIFVGAAVIFAASWIVGRFVPLSGFSKILVSVLVQVAFTFGLFVLLR